MKNKNVIRTEHSTKNFRLQFKMLHFLPEQYDQDRLPVKTAHVVRDALIAEHTEARNNQSVSYRRTHYLIGYVNVVYTRGEIK